MVRGQLKIQQMAFMLLAVTLFFVLVGLFVLVFQINSVGKQASVLESEKATRLVSKLANSPELSCGDAFYRRTNCVDADKALVLKDFTEYEEFWEVSQIQILKLYPEESNVECTKSNYPNCNLIKIFESSSDVVTYSNFVSLCRKESGNSGKYDKCEMALLLVGVK